MFCDIKTLKEGDCNLGPTVYLMTYQTKLIEEGS